MSIILLIILLISTGSYGELGIEKDLKSYILADFETGEVLEEYNIDETVAMASISKLMSYVIIMDHIKKEKISLDDIIIIDKDTTRVRGSSFKLKVGEEFTVKELLQASLVVSGNDATYALAKYVAGTEARFVNMMNERAREIGLRTAKFHNSTGLPIGENSIQNQMSTREIFKLSQYIIREHPEILEITTIKFIDMPSREFFQRNTNPFLMDIEGVDGLKTGFTNKAGYCYVSTFNIKGKEKLTKDLRLVGIVMGAKNFEERNNLSRILVEYGLANYSHKIFLDENDSLEIIEIPKATITEVNIYPKEGFTKLIHDNRNIIIKSQLDEIELPIKKGSRVGRVTIEENNEVLFETDLLIKEDIGRAKWYVIMGRSLRRLVNNIMEVLM